MTSDVQAGDTSRAVGTAAPLLVAAGAFGLGAALGTAAAGVIGWLLASAAVVLVLGYMRPHGPWARAGVWAAALGLGAATSAVEALDYERSSLRRLAASHTSDTAKLMRLYGTLAQDPGEVEARWLLLMDVETAMVDGVEQPVTGRARLYVDGQAPRSTLIEGDRVGVWARVGLPQHARNPGGFDSAGHAYRRGVHVVGACKTPALVEGGGRGRVGRLRYAVCRLRDAARRRLLAELGPGPACSIARAMVLGDRTGLTRESEEAFRIAGTYHVLALSGAQVALVAGLVLGALRWLRLPRMVVAGLTGGVIAAYVVFVGAEVPVTRAAVMAGALLLGFALDLTGEAANLLGAAALVLLAWRPSAIGDVAFQLSFAATLAIIWLVPLLSPWLRRLPRPIALLIASSVAAQIGVLPFMALHFHRLAPAALLLNLAAVPLASVVLIAGFGVALTGGWLPPLAWLAGRVTWAAAVAMQATSAWAAAVPGLDVRVVTPPAWLLLLYAVAAFALVYRPARRRMAVVLLTAAVGGLVVGVGGPIADGRLHLTALDVGAGDSLILQSPGGRVLVVDAGGTRPGLGANVGETVVAPHLWWRATQRLDVLALTHRHDDHVGGAPFLASHFRVGEVWTGPWSQHPATAGVDSPVPAVGRGALQHVEVTRGFRYLWDGVEIEALWPPADLAPGALPENELSLVLLVRMGDVRLLLTGDVGSASEAALRPGPVDVLKVGHHGSRSSSSEAFLEDVRPRIAILSTAANLAPAQEVLARHQRRGALVLRTDRGGAITVITDGQRLWAGTQGVAPSPIARNAR